MKKLLVSLAVALALVAVFVLGYAAYVLHSLDTPAFKAALLARTRAALGADVRVTKMTISVFSGVTLEGVTIANPAPFRGDLLAASSFALRYRLWPLLSGRLEVQRAAFVKPQLNLAMDNRGRFNYEGLGAPTAGRAGGGAASARATAVPGRALPVDIALRSVTVADGSIVLRDAARAVLMRAERVGLDARFDVTNAGLRGAGRTAIGAMALGESLFLRDLSAPLQTQRDTLQLQPIRGTVGGGELTGEAAVSLEDFHYTARLRVEGARVTTLVEEARSSSLIAGTLRASGSFEGSGGLAAMKGSGEIEIAHCRVSRSHVLQLLASILRVPELADPDLDRCVANFTLAGNRLNTPVLRLEGQQLQLTGSGTLTLPTRAIDYRMRLALARPLLNKITVRELRAAFQDRGDGFSTVDFDVTGTTLEPRTNLLMTVGHAAAIDAIKRGLGRLLERQRP